MKPNNPRKPGTKPTPGSTINKGKDSEKDKSIGSTTPKIEKK